MDFDAARNKATSNKQQVTSNKNDSIEEKIKIEKKKNKTELAEKPRTQKKSKKAKSKLKNTRKLMRQIDSNNNYKSIFHKDHLPATIGMFGAIIGVALFSLQIGMVGRVVEEREAEVFVEETIIENVEEKDITKTRFVNFCEANEDCNRGQICTNGRCEFLQCETFLPEDMSCKKREDHSCTLIPDNSKNGTKCRVNEKDGICNLGKCLDIDRFNLNEKDDLNNGDLNLFIRNYFNGNFNGKSLDFDENGKVDLRDYEMIRNVIRNVYTSLNGVSTKPSTGSAGSVFVKE